jgi:endonuclease YncB( thermonuclease family)
MSRFRRRRRESGPRNRTRQRIIRALIFVPLLILAGALLDPALIPPMGPTASGPERINTNFTVCGRGRSHACVVDGDTFRLGPRRVRIVGIDAPELRDFKCAREQQLAERATVRLQELLNQGPFDMIAHRMMRQDRNGRDLMAIERGGKSIGDQLIAEGLAHRYVNAKLDWCGGTT